MKKVVAFFEPEHLSDVKAALLEAGASSLTATNIVATDEEKKESQTFRGVRRDIAFHPMVRVEFLTSGEGLPSMKQAIQSAANGGQILVSDVGEVVNF
jgi:nitrogen regulatory protein PII